MIIRARATAAALAGLLTLLGLVAALVVGIGVAPARADDAAPSDPAGDASPPVATASTDEPLVVAGVAGLEWSDVDAVRTPNLWRLISGGDVASISVRVLAPTCPVDAWLTFSAGNRVTGGALTPEPGLSGDDLADADAAASTDRDMPPDLRCRPVPSVATTGAAHADGAEPASVTGWAPLTAQDATATGSYGSPGTLGDKLRAANVCSTAIGPGAAIALAGADGSVDRYLPHVATDEDELAAQLTACPVTVVDLGELPDPAVDRGDALRELDANVGRLHRALPQEARLIVAGIADTPLGQRALQVAVERGTGGQPTWLASPSSRREEGVVLTTDLPATVAAAAGVDLAGFDGSPLERGPERRLDTRATVDNRQYLLTLTEVAPPMNHALLGLLGILSALAIPVLVRRRRSRLAVSALTVGAFLPTAASLATLSRWWTSPAPGPVLAAAVAVPAAVLALLVWALDRPVARWIPDAAWRRPTLIAGLTWLVLTIDGVTGTTLQRGSPLGPSLADGARFYGFGNTVFAVYSVAALVLAAGLAASLTSRRRTVAGAIGLVTVIVNGTPDFGADAGGIVALVPAFVVLLMLLGGTRMRLRHWALTAGLTVVVVAAFALVAWLAPGGSHLGRFVQRITDGDALALVVAKAHGALATVSHLPGALAAILIVLLAWAVLAPHRRPWLRFAPLAAAYRDRPVLRTLVVALVVVTALGSTLNDTGVGVAVVVLLAAATTLGTGNWRVAVPDAAHVTAPAATVRAPRPPRGEPRRITIVGAGVLLVLLAGTGMLPPSLEHGHAGTQTNASPLAPESVVAAPGSSLVVIGTSGLRWPDLNPDAPLAPRLAQLLADGADAGGVSLPTGRSARCQDAGWLALSAGQLTEVADTRDDAGAWACPELGVDTTPGNDGATVSGWDALTALQDGSSLGAQLGRVGTLIGTAPVCSTAVGPGAAVALADGNGNVARYRTLDEALAPGTDAFDCPVTVIDAGAVLGSSDRAEQVAAVDLAAARAVSAAPADATVLVVDVGAVPGTQPALGIALLSPDSGMDDRPRFLSSTATRTEGVARLLDVPATVLDAVGVPVPSPLDDTSLMRAGIRPADTGTTADELADVTARDHVRRAAYAWFVDDPFYVAFAAAAVCWVVGARTRRKDGTTDRIRRRWWNLAEGVALTLASLPAAAFLGGLTEWWKFPNPVLALTLGTALTTATVAGLATLAPRDPVWARPGIVAGITFLALTVDGVVGTPLNRTSPLGSAPTFGARFFGFGNPTFSVYAVVGLVFAAALGQWLVARGHRRVAGITVSVIGVVALVVNVWPTFGADLGGGLVIVPAFVLVGFGALGTRVTFQRFVLVAAAGVGAVGVIGVLDWLRPAAERSHLGRFVDQVINGEAWALLARKAWFAARSLLGGLPVWLTVVVLLAAAVPLLGTVAMRARWTPLWLTRADAAWPLFRPALLAIWVISVLGSVVNDFGARIAMIALIPAIPLVLLTALNAARTAPDGPEPLEATTSRAGSGVR